MSSNHRAPMGGGVKTSSSSSSGEHKRLGTTSSSEYDNEHDSMRPHLGPPQPQALPRYGSYGNPYGYYNYYYQGGSGRYRPSEPSRHNDYIQVRLRDLIDPDRNRTFIDNLYAQFESNSNKINLIYVHPTLHAAPNSSRPLNNHALADTKLINEFYMNAYVRNQAYQHGSKT